MGKKTKKNRFNKSLDLDFVYSSNTIAEVDPTDSIAELNLSKEKAEELQKIRAKLPLFSHTGSLSNELAKLPTERPFKAFLYNMAFSVTESDITEFFAPLKITSINFGSGASGPRGFCFVDFHTRDDLAAALERNGQTLAGRSVNIRIADPNTNDRGGGHSRDKYSFGGDRQRGGYRPAALRDDAVDSGSSSWARGAAVNRERDSGSSHGFVRSSEIRTPQLQQPALAEESVARPKLNLLPRSVPVDKTEGVQRNAKIFGLAKPVDTASKDKVIEQRLNTNSTPGAQ